MCVAAILHTDNIHHMGMVKRLQMFGEVNSELLQQSRDVHLRRLSQATSEARASPSGDGSSPHEAETWPTRELSEVMWDADHRVLFRNLLLHFCDISNPMRPFHICSEWATFVLDEFFTQGDLEKQHELPVGALNDRHKTNFPFSQISFIDFFVAPLCFATVRILAPLEELADQLVENTRHWVEQWQKEEEHTEEKVQGVQDRLRKLEERNASLKSSSKAKPDYNKRRSVSFAQPQAAAVNNSLTLPVNQRQTPHGRVSQQSLGPISTVNSSPASLGVGGRERSESTSASTLSVQKGGGFRLSMTRRHSCASPAMTAAPQ